MSILYAKMAKNQPKNANLTEMEQWTSKKKVKKKPHPLRLGKPAAHPANAYCCFLPDLTGFTLTDRTGPNLHREYGSTSIAYMAEKSKLFFRSRDLFFC